MNCNISVEDVTSSKYVEFEHFRKITEKKKYGNKQKRNTWNRKRVTKLRKTEEGQIGIILHFHLQPQFKMDYFIYTSNHFFVVILICKMWLEIPRNRLYSICFSAIILVISSTNLYFKHIVSKNRQKWNTKHRDIDGWLF